MVNFFLEDYSFNLASLINIPEWLSGVCNNESVYLKELNYIFCSDSYLLTINQNFLKHDYYTDIVTFDNSDHSSTIEGDVFISLDRVADNSQSEQTSFTEELLRVIVHGLLHLIGYDDNNDDSRSQMRKAEDNYITLYYIEYQKE